MIVSRQFNESNLFILFEQPEAGFMDMFGKVPLVEIPVHVTPDQKKWLDKMVEEGRIAIPPGGTLEKGSVISMFIRMLIHNAQEEQMRQAAIEAEDEDDDDDE
jgi:hypothetical protein